MFDLVSAGFFFTSTLGGQRKHSRTGVLLPAVVVSVSECNNKHCLKDACDLRRGEEAEENEERSKGEEKKEGDEDMKQVKGDEQQKLYMREDERKGDHLRGMTQEKR